MSFKDPALPRSTQRRFDVDTTCLDVLKQRRLFIGLARNKNNKVRKECCKIFKK